MSTEEIVSGLELARKGAPEHVQVIEAMKDQLIIALIRRLGGKLDLPVAEIDSTGGVVLMMSVDQERRMFHFEVRPKQ
jgi:hypothetical protein